MFYKINNLPSDTLQKDFFLINNFLEQCPIVINKIAYEFNMMTIDITENMNLEIVKIMDSQTLG